MFMDLSETLQIAAAIITVAVLLSAAVSDVRSREVKDVHWAVLGLSGALVYLLLCVEEDGPEWECFAVPIGLALEFVALAFLDGTPAEAAGTGAVILFLLAFFAGDNSALVTQGLVAMAAVVAYAGLYYAGILRGGADAKCLMSISLALPYYPELGPFPLISADVPAAEFFPLSVSVLIIGAIIAAVWALIWYSKNAKRGRMPLEKIQNSPVWLYEEANEGRVISRTLVEEGKEAEAIDRLRDAGATDAKVVYKIPFVAPLALATVIVLLVGCPLFI
jgi:preflagellin peptidase FlaK